MRLLIVEDDLRISRLLVRGLREEQHIVDLVEDRLEGEAQALDAEYDAVLMLPGRDGFDVCRLREQGVDTPIVVVTARDAVPDRASWRAAPPLADARRITIDLAGCPR